jgi:hypothetical protein
VNVSGNDGFGQTTTTRLLAFEVFFDQLLFAAETIDPVLVLLADFGLIAHHLLLLPRNLPVCQYEGTCSFGPYRLTMRLDKDMLTDSVYAVLTV